MTAVALKGRPTPKPKAASTRGKAAPAARKRDVAKKKKPSALAQLLGRLPVAAATWERLVTWAVMSAVAAGLVVAAVALGVPTLAAETFNRGVAGLGFVVKRVDVVGLKHMDRLTVYAVALDQKTRSMAEIDLDAIRNQLLQHGWIADARVTRRLPDTLVIDLVERQPAAVWQVDGRLALIDRAGVVLERVEPGAMPDLPLLIGRNANKQADALTTLLQDARRLRPLVAGATWIGNRRWDLRFQSGETLSLPEGEAAARTALNKFEGLDAQNRLLGRGFLRFDMRAPDRMFLKVDRRRPQIDAAPLTAPSGENKANDTNKGGVA